MIVILVASSILLLFNLVLSKFVKSKVLLLVINLVLSLTLISSSIALFVNLKKKLKSSMTLEQLNNLINKVQTDINSKQINFKIANNNYKIANDIFNDYNQLLNIDLFNAKSNLKIAQDIYNKSNNPTLYPKQKQDIQDATNKLNEIQAKLSTYDGGSGDNVKTLKNFEDNVNSNQLILNDAQLALTTSQKNLENYIFQKNIINYINLIEGISYSSAAMSIISGILNLLINFF